MEDLNSSNKRVHKIMLTNRRTCTINGVSDVLSLTSMRYCWKPIRGC